MQDCVVLQRDAVAEEGESLENAAELKFPEKQETSRILEYDRHIR